LGLFLVPPVQSTVSTAPVLVTVPRLLFTWTVNTAPLSTAAIAGVVYVAAVAPLIFTPFLCHWKVSGGDPAPVTENVAVWPTDTVTPYGCVAIEAATDVPEIAGGPLDGQPVKLQPT